MDVRYKGTTVYHNQIGYATSIHLGYENDNVIQISLRIFLINCKL